MEFQAADRQIPDRIERCMNTSELTDDHLVSQFGQFCHRCMHADPVTRHISLRDLQHEHARIQTILPDNNIVDAVC